MSRADGRIPIVTHDVIPRGTRAPPSASNQRKAPAQLVHRPSDVRTQSIRHCMHMGSLHMLASAALTILIFHAASCTRVKHFPLLMPNVHPNRDELYLCTPIKMVPNKTFYIVGFEPNATMATVHHMMVFGCPVPGTEDRYWDCGEMAADDGNSGLKKANPCKGNSHVLFAWARDAKALKLPEDVGFQVGPETEIQYIILQIHYSKKFPPGKRDNSGIFLQYTEKPQSKLAGVILLGTGGVIQPMSEAHMEADCEIKEKKTIYPFAYRTHTHSLGKVVSGYHVRRDAYGHDHWHLLGKRDPMTPQMFYPVFSRDPITFGDKLAARCTMVSDRTIETHVGATNKDEMCNFYLMYYVKVGTPLERKYCISLGPPFHYWDSPNSDLNHIPDQEASTL